MKSVCVLLMVSNTCMHIFNFTAGCLPKYQTNKYTCIQHKNQNHIEFKCAYGNGLYLIILVFEEFIEVDCGDQPIKTFSTIPNLQNTSFRRVQLRRCPFTLSNLNNFFEYLRINTPIELAFEHSNIQSLETNVLYNMKHLTYLSLKCNTLSFINMGAFAHSSFLNTLDLQDNQIMLYSEMFVGLNNLTSLNLTNNKIRDIPNGLFKPLSRLHSLQLCTNEITVIHKDTFDGLISLTQLDLSNNLINHIANQSFSTLHKLTNLSLSLNKLSYLDGSFFSSQSVLLKLRLDWNPLKFVSSFILFNFTSLEEIWMNNCLLKSLPFDIFTFCSNLTIIKLNNNKLTSLPSYSIKNLYKLHELDVSNNSLLTVPSININKHYSLKWLNLSYNRLSLKQQNEVYRFYFLLWYTDLEVLDLSHNNITSIKIFPIGSVLKTINLSHNYISKFSDNIYALFMHDIEIDLRSNNITEMQHMPEFHMREQFVNTNLANNILHISDNPINCNCEAAHMFQHLHDTDLYTKLHITINTENLKCVEHHLYQTESVKKIQNGLHCYTNKLNKLCAKGCKCFLEPYENSLTINCANSKLTSYPVIQHDDELKDKYNQTFLYLQDNKLSEGPKYNFIGYGNITKLILSRNNIESIEWLPLNLSILHLDNNKIKQFSNDVINRMKNLKLALAGNPWQCNCELLNLTHFLREHRDQVMDEEAGIKCANSDKNLVNLYQYDLCENNFFIYLTIGALIVLIIVTTIVAICVQFITEIKILLYARNICLWWITEYEIDKDKVYDAFISFSNKDEDFVIEDLLPVLEDGPNPYKLCLHYRNWIPGEFIAKQILDSVEQSRRTIVILTKNFLESVWSKLELRTAHTQAMNEGRTRVIVILYGDICENDVDDELKAYLKSNTYVKWGDRWFWDKLKYAMPHSNLNK